MPPPVILPALSSLPIFCHSSDLHKPAAQMWRTATWTRPSPLILTCKPLEWLLTFGLVPPP